MPIDASIPLGFKQPDPTQQLSGLLNVVGASQKVKSDQITLQERQAMQQVLSDPSNYTDPDGSFNMSRAQASIMRAAPTTGAKYITDLAQAHAQSTAATQALNNLTTDNRMHIGGVLASLPPGATPELVGKTIDALTKQYKGIEPAADVFLNGYRNALKSGGQQGADQFIQQSARGVLPQDTQQAMNTPNVVTVNNGQQQVGFNVKPGVQSYAQGAPVFTAQNQIPPTGLENVQQDAQGNQFVVSRTPSGAVVGTRPLQSATPAAPGPFRLPLNETKATLDELQGQRNAAQQAAVAAPVMHDINRTIVSEASKGLNTGTLGALTQKLMSATGYQLQPGEKATDYNVLGKMLERSALTAAQSMGPHTNAGLEAAVRANGSLDYTPQALKKIAYLNDALVTGSEMYQHGLERAIEGSPNGVFAKRQFDQEWGRSATPQALRLKNAVDTGNKEEIENIIKEVGGKGTKGAQALYSQIKRIRELAGE